MKKKEKKWYTQVTQRACKQKKIPTAIESYIASRQQREATKKDNIVNQRTNMLQSNTTNADLKSYSNGIYLLKKRKKGKRKKQAISLSSHDSFFALCFVRFFFLSSTLWHIIHVANCIFNRLNHLGISM